MTRVFLTLVAMSALLWCSIGDSGAQPAAGNLGKSEPPVGWPREVKRKGSKRK